MSGRQLIVNADDFGLSEATNAGIVRAHDEGIVTSASLMVCQPAAAAAAAWARSRPALSVGLHVDLGEWAYEHGEWVLLYERGPAESEVPAQFERFRALMGRDPTHIDSHQHVHREGIAAEVIGTLAERLGAPLRGHGPITHFGSFYGQTGTGDPLPEVITTDALTGLIEALPTGISELGCHPGLDTDLASPYRLERLREVEVLCDPRVRRALARERVELRSFGLAT